jgi:glycosyltransferase involved in cell wall biosynthesis
MFLAHHTFVNPIIMQIINQEREESGKKRIPLAVFAHGTAMKMYDHEIKGEKDFPMKFYKGLLETGIFGSGKNKSNVVFTISKEEKKNFLRLFPGYNPQDVVVSGNGFNTQYFKPFSERPSLSKALEGIVNVIDGKPLEDLEKYDKSVIFTGKFADWKRLDSLLLAAKSYETVLKDTKGWEVATIIAGTGPDEKTRNFYYGLAKDLNLKNTFFIGSQDQPTLAKINNAVDLGVYPSKDEPFGLVLIEAMACGTPVIGANSGGPKDYVHPEFGGLIPETEDKNKFAQNLSQEVQKALIENWKKTKGLKAAKFAHSNFTPEAQCNQIIREVKKRSD